MSDETRNTLGRLLGSTGWPRVQDELRVEARDKLVLAGSEAELLDAARDAVALERLFDMLDHTVDRDSAERKRGERPQRGTMA